MHAQRSLSDVAHGLAFRCFLHSFHTEASVPSQLSRAALDDARKALRTPSFNSGHSHGFGVAASLGSGGGSGGGSTSEGQFGSDWSSFDVDVFVNLVDYARDRLRDTRALLLAIRDASQVPCLCSLAVSQLLGCTLHCAHGGMHRRCCCSRCTWVRDGGERL